MAEEVRLMVVRRSRDAASKKARRNTKQTVGAQHLRNGTARTGLDLPEHGCTSDTGPRPATAGNRAATVSQLVRIS